MALILDGTNGLTYTGGTASNVSLSIPQSVGIGTAAPLAALDVRGSSSLLINANTPTAWVSSDATLTTQSMYLQVNTSANDTRIGSYTNHALGLYTNNTARITIDTAGNVGIGTSSPGYKLDVNGGITSRLSFGNSLTANIICSAPSSAQGQLAGIAFMPTFVGTGDNGARRAADIWAGFNAGNWGTQYLAFGVGSAVNDVGAATPERMRIDSSGNVGIGTTTNAIANKLSVVGNISLQSGTMPMPIQPMLTSPSGKARVTFSCTGALQSWTVPAGVTSILVKLWGAGGGGGNTGGWVHGSRGGGGGHTLGIVPCTPGQVFYIVVGQGGQTNYAGTTTPNFGGGGGFQTNSDNRYSGAGGGYTGFFNTNTITQANAILIAGGGGGGGTSRFFQGNWGGGGGGVTGQNGASSFDGRSAAGGGGGTQSAGGAAGSTQSGVTTAGSALTGGYSSNGGYGGGGGGGYFGGGGGGYFESNSMSGGGGGSGYVNTSLSLYGATFCAYGDRPAMYDDQDLPKTYDGFNNWGHYAVGGNYVNSSAQYTSAGGGSGVCVIYY